MHRTIKCLVAALLAVSLCWAAGALAESLNYTYYTQLPAAQAPSMSVTLPIPAENPVQEGVNPLTGEVWYGTYHPIMVNIDTHPDGWPHWGVSSADITYELPLQSDGSTRSVALFMGNIPAWAGPVRSGRVPMASLREIWGGPWVFYGWQNKADANSSTPDLVVDVDDWANHFHQGSNAGNSWHYPYIEGIGTYQGQFNRVNDKNHVSPHNVQADLKAIEALIPGSITPHPFKFTETGLEYGIDVNHILIEHKTTKPAYISEYYYNDLTGQYDRYRNGEVDTDALNNMSLSYSNVIILRTNVSWYLNNPSRPVIQLVGQGVAEIFQNGKYIRGYWARASKQGNADQLNAADLASRMIFYDDQGNELALKKGKTFIQIESIDQPVVVTSVQQINGGIAQATPQPTATPAPTRTPRPTRTPKAGAATPAPVEQVEDGDQEFTFGI